MEDNKYMKENTLPSKSSSQKNLTSADVSDTARELAQNALMEFNKNNYSTVGSLLVKLQASRPKDIKVVSNKAVVDYYVSGLRNTESFLKSLSDICFQNNIKFSEIKSSDELDASVIRLNRATVLFHQKQFYASKAVLQSMYKGLESLEESVSIGLCLLMAEVLQGLSCPKEAFAVISHTVATFLPQPLQPQSHSSKLHYDKDANLPHNSENVFLQESSVASLERSAIMSSHDNSDADSIGGSSEMRCSTDQELLRCKLQTLCVRSLLQMRMLKVAKRELSSLVTHSLNVGKSSNPTLIMLKSQLEYMNENFTDAAKILHQISTSSSSACYGPPLGVAFNNNMGLIYVGVEKPNLAQLYLKKAMQELKSQCTKDWSATKLGGGSFAADSLYNDHNDTWVQLCYNVGLSLLIIDWFVEAFEFFIEVTKHHSSSFLLWLRLAECCIGVHKNSLASSEKDDNILKLQVMGSGSERKLILNPDMKSHNKNLVDQQITPDPALPVPTLEFGRLCLRTCLSLLPKSTLVTKLVDDVESTGFIPKMYSCCPSSPLTECKTMELHQHCLACSSYISLCLGDYYQALVYADSLLALMSSNVVSCNFKLKLLGRLYAGEALILLGRPNEALAHLTPLEMCSSSSLSVEEKSNKNDLNWDSLDSRSETGLMFNLCVALTQAKQFDRAYLLLRVIMDNPKSKVPAQVIMLALYLNIKLGLTDSIKGIINKGLSTSYLIA